MEIQVVPGDLSQRRRFLPESALTQGTLKGSVATEAGGGIANLHNQFLSMGTPNKQRLAAYTGSRVLHRLSALVICISQKLSLSFGGNIVWSSKIS